MNRRAGKVGKRGHPETFSESAIQFCLTVKVLFGLPLRQTAGLVASLLEMAGLGTGRAGDWPVPDYSTLCRRQARLAVQQIPYRRTGAPLNLLIDSTGVKLRGDGAWPIAGKTIPRIVFWPGSYAQAWPLAPQGTPGCATGSSNHGVRRKVHIAVDTGTGDIPGVAFTSSRQGDSPLLPELLTQIPEDEDIATVTADGADDTRRCHAAIIERGADAAIPIRRNGRAWKEDCPAAIARNGILSATRRLGQGLWKRGAGYHIRSRIEV